MKVTIVLRGGLGNQMFQYALATSLRAKGFEVALDTSMYDITRMHNGYELEHVFGIKEKLVEKTEWHSLYLRTIIRLQPSKLVLNDSLDYNDQVTIKPKRYLNGYWQDERYFINVAHEIHNVFRFKLIDDKTLRLANEMQRGNSISIHIRRGDYASFGMSMLNVDYYRSAVDFLYSRVDVPHFYIFSDEAKFADELARTLGLDYTLIDFNNCQEAYKDMYLMSQCKHNIIANSSFSWWGAWLNKNEHKIIIAPKVWDEKRSALRPQLLDWVLM